MARAGFAGQRSARRHSRARRPGRVPVPRLCAAPARRRRPGHARRRAGRTRARQPAARADGAPVGQLRTKSRLDSYPREELAAAIDGAAAAAVASSAERAGVLDGRFAELERARLARLAREWLESRARARRIRSRRDAKKSARSKSRGLAFTGRIDRMDRLADGARRRPRPDRLQNRPRDAEATGSASGRTTRSCRSTRSPRKKTSPRSLSRSIKTGEMRFMGLTREDKVLPKVKAGRTWSWIARRLGDASSICSATSFARGVARVDPKRGLKTCRHCDLQPLCRVHERIAALEDDEEGDDE